MANPLYVVDAFTSGPFTGNPAAVCFLDEPPADEAWFQQVAAEMNLSETAFVNPAAGGGFNLRWFTPAVEVDLCGHATLATAHALWEAGRLPAGTDAVFATRGGRLVCRRDGPTIAMDFPAEPPTQTFAPPALVDALGSQPEWVGRNRLDYFVLLASEAELRGLAPDIGMLANVETRGIIVTARSSGEFDFVSRAFFPRLGVPEDPVCGSAHCGLGPLWRDRLGKDELRAYQASRRGGEVSVRCAGARVTLGGRARTVVRGELLA
jgi:PhzF family phenazine biosynthesis protein